MEWNISEDRHNHRKLRSVAAARCIGIDPSTIDHIRWLYEAGIGEIADIEVVGDGIDTVYQKWELN